MTSGAIWALIAGMAVVNFAVRFPSLAILSRSGLPAWAKRWLSFIPVSAMATLVIGSVVRPDGKWLPVISNPYLWAAAGTGLVYWKWRNFMGATLSGIVMFLVLKALLG